MKNAALLKKNESFAPTGEHGTVTRTGDGWIEVASEGGVLRARRAASCLLAPAVGDEVLVAIVARRPAYVLAVLERAPGARNDLDLAGDTTLRVAGGRLSLSADGLDLLSSADANVSA